MSKTSLTAQDLTEMSDADFAALDDDLIKNILADERAKAARLQRRHKGLQTGELNPASFDSIADALNVTRQTIEKTNRRALLKLKHKHPELSKLLKL